MMTQKERLRHVFKEEKEFKDSSSNYYWKRI